jgi:hypothetical protein
MKKAILMMATFALVGCEDKGGEKCSDKSVVTGRIVSAPTREPVTADLVVRGVITAPDNATVYGVQVNGIDATSSTLNFRNWTATIPLGVLALQSQTGSVTLSAVAFTNCGEESEVGTSVVMVDGMPGILVSQLRVTPAIPGGHTYLPSSKPISAVVTISGNAQAAGVSVALSTTVGKLSADHVTLAGDGTSDAVGYVMFSSTDAGTAVITATAIGKSGSGSITVIGPPTFAPDGTSIHAGSSLRVTVLTTGTIDSCQATPAAGMHVTSGPNTDLMRGAGGMDQTMDGLIDIDVAVDTGITAPISTTISCRDPFGQLGTALFTGSP